VPVDTLPTRPLQLRMHQVAYPSSLLVPKRNAPRSVRRKASLTFELNQVSPSRGQVPLPRPGYTCF
jgi:hypothetical protein